ncbi:unnamed protein product [Ectocarpus sp. 12 AP-2014]
MPLADTDLAAMVKVLLADFGLAKQLPKGDPGLLVGACGTKPYLAPELVRDVPYDAAVDMWAVGVVTYELLHGYTPFSPKLVVPRSWDGVVREEYARKSNANNRSRLANGGSRRRRRRESHGCGYSDDDATTSSSSSGSTGEGGSLSVSESSGSVVNKRMFERSAPPAPGGGLDRAWLAGQAHQALLFGKGGENDEYQAERRTGEGHGIAGGGGRGAGGEGVRRRRGHREQDQLKLLEAVVRGGYEVEEGCVGEVGADFISQLLHVSPARRMSAEAAAEHPFLGPASKVPPRRRAARAEVAAVQTERAAAAAQRHKARLQQQQQQEEEAAGRKPMDAGAAAAAAAATALSDIAVLAGAMSDEARSLLADTKRWDKAAAAAAAVAGADAGAGASGKNGSGVLPAAAAPAGKAAVAAAVADAVGKAEAAVARAELLARESRAGSLAAEAVANSRELARAQEAAAAAAEAGQAPDATAATAAAAAVLKKGGNTVTGTGVGGGDKADGVVAGDQNGAAKTVFRFQ